MTLFVPLVLEEVEVSNKAIDETRRMLFVVAERAQQSEDTEAALAGNTRARR